MGMRNNIIFDWSAILRKIQSTFSTVLLIRIVGGKSWNPNPTRIFGFQTHKIPVSMATENAHSTNLKIALKLITRNCNLSKYFYKTQLNYTYLVTVTLYRVQIWSVELKQKVSKFCMHITIIHQVVIPAVVYILAAGHVTTTPTVYTVFAIITVKSLAARFDIYNSTC